MTKQPHPDNPTLEYRTSTITRDEEALHKHIDVLGLIKWDWANSGYRFTEALKKLDLNAKSYKGTPLAYFNYPHQLPTLPILSTDAVDMYPVTTNANDDPTLQHLIKHTKVIYLFGTQYLVNIDIPLDTKIIVQHGGIIRKSAILFTMR